MTFFRLPFALAGALVLFTLGAQAHDFDERALVRFRYGADFRSGSQSDLGPGLTYDGWSANDFALSSWLYGTGFVGGFASVQREGFGLYGPQGRVTGGALWRAAAGPSARLGLSRVQLSAQLAYQVAQLPLFDSSLAPGWSPAMRHGALVRAAALTWLGPIWLEVRGELPIALATVESGGGSARSSGYSLGAALGVRLGELWPGAWSAFVDYESVSDRLTTSGGAMSDQLVSRVGAFVELSWLGASARKLGSELVRPEAAPDEPVIHIKRTGAILIKVVDRESKQALSGATVRIQDVEHLTSASGELSLAELPVGPLVLEVGHRGHRSVEETAAVVDGVTSNVEVALASEQKRVPATLTGLVRSAAGGRPLAADVEIPELGIKKRANEKGAFSMSVPGGTYTVVISAPGHLPQSKSVTIRDGEQAILDVDLHEK